MKRQELLLLAFSTVIISPAFAADKYWDPSTPASSPASGGTGTWIEGGNDSSGVWRTSSTGGGGNGRQAFDNDDTAYFTAGSGTVTISGTVDTNGITFQSGAGAYTITGGTSARLDLTAGGITNNSTTEQIIASAVRFDAGNRTINTVSGNILISGNIDQDGSSRQLTKTGDQTLILSGNNSYAGATTVNAGVLNIRSNTALGTTAGGTTVASGAALELQGGITVGNEALSLNGTGVGNNGALRNVSGNNTYNGTISAVLASTKIQSDSGLLTLAAIADGDGGVVNDLIFDGAGNTTVTGAITTLQGAVTKNGTGTLRLAGANTFSGATTINGGTLEATTVNNGGSSSSSIGTSNNAAASLVLNGGTLSYVGSSAASSDRGFTVEANGATIAANGTTASNTLTFASTGGALAYGANNQARALTLRGANTGNNSFAKVIADNGSGKTTLNKEDAGKWILNAANTYTGGTNINGGELALGANDRLANTGAVTVNGGTFNLGGFSDTVGAVTLQSGAINNGTLTGSSYDVRSGSVSAVLAGNGALTKTTNDTVTLSGNNTYTGGTSVSAGTLSAGNVNAFGTGAINVTGGTLALNNLAVTNAITLAGGTLTGTSSTSNVTVTGDAAVTGTYGGQFNAGTLASRAINTAGNVTINGRLSGQGVFSGGRVTVNGEHAIGNSPGQQTFNDGLAYGAASTLEWEIVGNNLATAGTDYDQALVNGGVLSIAPGATLEILASGVDYTDSAWDVNRSFAVVLLGGTGTFNGTDSFILDVTSAGNTVGEGSWSLVSSGTGVNAVWTAVPEPSVALLGGLSAFALLRRRRND